MPDSRRELLAAHLERSAQLAPAFRWIRPESLHLTLRFVGGIEAELVDRLGDELGRIRQDAFELALGAAGSFGRGRRTRVLWLGVAVGSDPLRRLAEAVEAACARLGLPGDVRTFNPHLTLARSRDPGGSPSPELPELADLQPWLVDEFWLYRSQLRLTGAVYSTLRRYPLTGRGGRPG